MATLVELEEQILKAVQSLPQEDNSNVLAALQANESARSADHQAEMSAIAAIQSAVADLAQRIDAIKSSVDATAAVIGQPSAPQQQPIVNPFATGDAS